MKLAKIGCALGKHSLDRNTVRRVHGAQVGRCRHCNSAMEETQPNVWALQRVHDAGLGRRYHF